MCVFRIDLLDLSLTKKSHHLLRIAGDKFTINLNVAA